MKIRLKKFAYIGALLAIVTVGFALLSDYNAAAQGSALRVLCSDGMQKPLRELTPQIEKSLGRKLDVRYDSSKLLVDEIKEGKAFDATILTTGTLDEVIKQGKVAADSRIQLARGGVGIGVRSGAPKPDISTPEAMKQALLNAKVITYNSTGQTGVLANKMFEHLGIADAIKSKIKADPVSGGAQKMVAEGRADLVIILIPEVTQIPGVDYAGPLPGDLQTYVNFEGGLSASSHDPEKAKAFLKFLTTPEAMSVVKSSGLEPR